MIKGDTAWVYSGIVYIIFDKDLLSIWPKILPGPHHRFSCALLKQTESPVKKRVSLYVRMLWLRALLIRSEFSLSMNACLALWLEFV